MLGKDMFLEIARYFLLTLMCLTFVGIVISWLLIVYSAFGMCCQFSDKEKRYSYATLWNPMNAILNPSVLNEDGLKSRKRAILGIKGFVFSFFTSVGLAFTVKFLDKFL